MDRQRLLFHGRVMNSTAKLADLGWWQFRLLESLCGDLSSVLANLSHPAGVVPGCVMHLVEKEVRVAAGACGLLAWACTPYSDFSSFPQPGAADEPAQPPTTPPSAQTPTHPFQVFFQQVLPQMFGVQVRVCG